MRLIIYFIVGFLFYTFQPVFAKPEQSIKKEITDLQKTIDSFENLQQEIKSLEQQLGKISQQKYKIEKKIKVVSKKLRETNKKKRKFNNEFEIQKVALAQQLQAFHTAGTQSHLRLLLRQDNPSDITRTFKYFDYLYENRAKKITYLKGMMRKIDILRYKVTQDKIKLQDLRTQHRQQEQDLQSVLAIRSSRIKLYRQIPSKKKRLKHLRRSKKHETKFQDQIEKITNRSLNSPALARKVQKTHPTKRKIVQTHFTPNKPFSTLRGKLSWPVRGKILHSYRTRRNEKQRWQGVVIRASGGNKVKAIAKGQIAFSGWMNGYGYIVMVEHDKNYLSIYGYNRAVYKKEGAVVHANEVIAAVGNSGGQKQNALYFEIRKGKKPQNPARWCR